MEVIRCSHHAAFPMGDPSRVGQARRHAAEVAQEAGLGELQAGRLALVVTELGNNLQRHAQDGVLLIAWDPRGVVEVVAVDKGPGIANLQRSMMDGFSTGGTPGTGLGALGRLSTGFDAWSMPGVGSIFVSRIAENAVSPAAAAATRVSGMSVPVHTEVVCGDAWAAVTDGPMTALIVADGLGHGPDAAEASKAAVTAFLEEPMAAPREVVQRVHMRLRSTRGAAVLSLLLNASDSCIDVCGAGNVVGRLVAGDSDRTLLSQHGTAGVQIRKPEQVSVPWPPHASLVVHTDGIETRWSPELLLPVLRSDPTVAAGLLFSRHSRGRDDATAVVIRRNR